MFVFCIVLATVFFFTLIKLYMLIKGIMNNREK